MKVYKYEWKKENRSIRESKRQIHTIFIRETYSELETTGKNVWIRDAHGLCEDTSFFKCDLMNSVHAPVNDNPFILQIGLI